MLSFDEFICPGSASDDFRHPRPDCPRSTSSRSSLASIRFRQILLDFHISQILIYVVELDAKLTLVVHQIVVLSQIILRFHLI